MFVLRPGVINIIEPARHRVPKASKIPGLGIEREECVDSIFLVARLKDKQYD